MASYQPHPFHKPEPCYKPKVQYKHPKTRFDGSTTASDAYQTWPVQRREKPGRSKPKQTKGAQEFLIKTSSYQVRFKLSCNKMLTKRPTETHHTACSRPRTIANFDDKYFKMRQFEI